MAARYKTPEIAGEPFYIGATIQLARKRAGFKNVDEFTAAIESRTGVTINHDQMQRIEADRQAPTLAQYVAISITLGRETDSLIVEALPDSQVKRALEAGFKEELAKYPEIKVEETVLNTERRCIEFIYNVNRSGRYFDGMGVYSPFDPFHNNLETQAKGMLVATSFELI